MAHKRALIVDDSTTAQYRLKKMLRAYPLDIDIVDSGEAALRYLAHHSPDVVFMDHMMPGMDGFRALQIIKSHPETAMIPVIMYTSQSGDVYTGQARALGALDVVSKDRINATDLSRVMETIHIYPTPKDKDATEKTGAENSVESPALIAAANQVTATNQPLERRAPNQAAMEQARNLELRLSHLEHSLEDNRRFITSRVSRELQNLRQSLHQELSSIIQQPAPAAVTPPPEEPAPSNSSWGTSLLVLIGIIASLFLLWQIKTLVERNNQQQDALTERLQELAQQPPAPLAAPVTAAPDSAVHRTAAMPLNPRSANNDLNYLEDLVWVFNQHSTLQFRQYTMDTSTLLRLHEVLHRLTSRGFKGLAAITIYVGDFCITKDSNGMDQLAPENSHLSNCLLSSELYGMDRLQTDFARETDMMLRNLTSSINSPLQVDIHALEGPEPYPERLPTVSAGEWNSIAQKNNRIELILVEDNNE